MYNKLVTSWHLHEHVCPVLIRRYVKQVSNLKSPWHLYQDIGPAATRYKISKKLKFKF